MKTKLIIASSLILTQNTHAIEILEYEDRLLHSDYVCALNATPLDNEVINYQYFNNTLICNYKDETSKILNNINQSRYHNSVENDNYINVLVVKDDPNRNYEDYQEELMNFEEALNNATNKNTKIRILGSIHSDFKHSFDDNNLENNDTNDPNFSHNIFKNSFYYDYNSLLNADYYLFLINQKNGGTEGVADSLFISASQGLTPEGVVISNHDGENYDKNNYLYTHEFGHTLGLSHDIVITNAKDERKKTEGKHIRCEISNYLDLSIPYGKAKYLPEGVTAMGYDDVRTIDENGEPLGGNRLNQYSTSNNSFTRIFSTTNFRKEISKCQERDGVIGFTIFISPLDMQRTTGYIAEADSAKALEITLPMLLNKKQANYDNPMLLNINYKTNDNIYVKDILAETINNFGNDNYFISTGELNNSFSFDFIDGDNTVHIPYLQETNNKTLDIDISNFDFNDSLIISNGYNSLTKKVFPKILSNYIVGFYLEYFNSDNSLALSLNIDFKSGVEQKSNKLNLSFNSINNEVFDNYAEAFYNADSTGVGMIKDFKKVIIAMDNVFEGTESDDSHNEIGGTNQPDEIYGFGGDDILGDSNQTDTSDWWIGNTNLDYKDFFGDTFYGGLDNDTIYGTRYGDYYYYEAGDGQDVIYEQADLELDSDSAWQPYTKDVLVLEGIYEDDFEIVRNDYDIIIDFKYTTDQITIVNALKRVENQGLFYNLNAIEEISFNDGYYNLEQIIKKALVVKGTNENDNITGLSEYRNVFESSFGIDTYIGSPNRDIYNISTNIDSLTIQEIAGDDELNFIGFVDLTFIEENGNINVYDSNNNLIVKIEGFTIENNLIETINIDGISYTSNNFQDIILPEKNCEGSDLTRSELELLIVSGKDYSKACVGKITDFSKLFYNKNVNYDITNWNVSSGVNFTSMFSRSSNFNQNIGNWDVSNGTNFTSMFAGAHSFNQNIGNWDVSNGTNFTSMFAGTHLFNQNINEWNVSNGVRFDRMFSSAKSFNQNINKWNVSNGVRFDRMFFNADSFNKNIGNWNVSNGVVFDKMFQDALKFNQDIRTWNTFNASRWRDFKTGSALLDDYTPLKFLN